MEYIAEYFENVEKVISSISTEVAAVINILETR